MLKSANELTRLATAILVGAGVPEAAARIQTELLIEAELRGHSSHGILRLPRLVDRISNGVADPVAIGVHRWAGETLLEVEGRDGLGPVVAMHALEVVTARARVAGIAAAAISGSNHLGMLSWYVEKIAEAGQIGVCLTTSEAIVHPWGGRQALVGSNPIAVGVPADPAPLVLDMATSATSMGNIHDHANRNLALDPTWAVNHAGEPTTDPQQALTGSLNPFGGAKGYGLAVAFETLVASMTGTALGREVVGTLDDTLRSTKGDLFVVMTPPHPGAAMAVGSYLRAVRSSPRRRPDEQIRVPGDGMSARRARALEEGIDVPDDVWIELQRRMVRIPVRQPSS